MMSWLSPHVQPILTIISEWLMPPSSIPDRSEQRGLDYFWRPSFDGAMVMRHCRAICGVFHDAEQV